MPLFLLLVASVFAQDVPSFYPQSDTPEIEVEVLKLPRNDDSVLDPLSLRRRHRREVEDEDGEEKEGKKGIYNFLYDRMLDEANSAKKKRPVPEVYKIPGPQEPLPGRSHNGDYWPVFPFQNQFSAGLDLDPSISRHIGGDFNLAVPSWGMLDIYGRFFNRIHDTTTKIGYLNHPVNMLDLDRNDYVKLMSDPSLHWNRNAQPLLPLGKLARSYVPLNCKPPLCNPYTMTFGLGIEQDYGGNDGVEGDIDVPIPISKGVAYRFPFSGKVYYARDNITVTYGQNLAPIDPMHSMFDYQYTRDPNLAIPRSRRHVSHSQKVWNEEIKAKTFAEYLHSHAKRAHSHSASSSIPPFAETYEIPFTDLQNQYSVPANLYFSQFPYYTPISAYSNPYMETFAPYHEPFPYPFRAPFREFLPYNIDPRRSYPDIGYNNQYDLMSDNIYFP